jgi:hypothetical protein
LAGDAHSGGSDTTIARYAALLWADIYCFWKWVKQQGLDEQITIIVTQEFGRGNYNSAYQIQKIYTKLNGTTVLKDIISPGRDHGLFMGTMFLNKNVPPASRIGNIVENLVPLPGSNTTGGVISNAPAYNQTDIIGSMFMRIYPKLFPSEKSVRQYWASFEPIDLIIK